MMIAALCPKQNPPSFLLFKVCKYVQLGAKKLRYSEEPQIWFYLISCSVLNSAVFENPMFCTMPICNVIGAFQILIWIFQDGKLLPFGCLGGVNLRKFDTLGREGYVPYTKYKM